MYDYIHGKLIEANPSYAVVDAGGVGYFINISLQSYSQLSGLAECKLFIHQIIREDTNALYGFFTKYEREMFRYLISVSGVGANTARMMLSSLTSAEIQNAIVHDKVLVLKGIKGIGEKTAQRIIIELRDKIGKMAEVQGASVVMTNSIKDEALSALVMLGFAKNASEKVIDKIIAENMSVSVEEIVKKSLKML